MKIHLEALVAGEEVGSATTFAWKPENITKYGLEINGNDLNLPSKHKADFWEAYRADFIVGKIPDERYVVVLLQQLQGQSAQNSFRVIWEMWEKSREEGP